MVFQQTDGKNQDIVEIHAVALLELILVKGVHLGYLAHAVFVAGQADLHGRFAQRVFPAADLPVDRLRHECLLVETQFGQASLDHLQLVVCVDNGKIAVESEPIRETAQHPDHHRMEGADPHGHDLVADQLFDAPFHLGGSLVGERDRQDLRRPDTQHAHQPCDPMRDDPRLA